MSKPQPALIDAPVCGAYCCAGAPWGGEGLSPRRNVAGKQLCETCGTRLDKVKHTHPHGPGRACHPRCKPSKHAVDDAARPAVAAAPAADPRPSRKRRAASDPGEPLNLTRLCTREPPPTSIPPVKKTRVQSAPVDISLLLDQTHARRLALIASEEKSCCPHSALNGSATIWKS